ncbi:Panacea domain-containing protein [Roseospirillum parvum]|uniref:Uncharacterized phage-associated protein n=1 Tax=Roseospirillum parvum TaxID=83401 RepID=A0A1G7XKH6_9PROT|nr:hypothetical protein [Roseospirillum parvum]SDG84714.1 Uncharacterized phage-associated protein [Roseospirillum parvum]
MLPIPVDSGFDVAFRLIDKAMDDAEYLQPQKLHRLLFLAQAYYAVANRGRRLIPGVFVADPSGPLEPTLFRAFENGRPPLEPKPLAEPISHFLDSIWRKFGAHSADHLTRLLKSHPPFQEAAAQGPRSEITLKAMVLFYGRKQTPGGTRPAGAPAVEDVVRPRVMRSHTGKPVNVTQWMPKSHKSTK